MPTRQGSFRLFKLFGITVYLHWAWFFLAAYYVQYRVHAYSSSSWTLLEFLCLFAIVLTHEFGHQLACRSVGGRTEDIVLWVLGGVAYVSPPQRPGAQLWSIAAGPLVNVLLVPILSALALASSHLGWHDTNPDLYDLIHNVWFINVGLLVFNMLPIYPLDGGQILRSLLWFMLGRAKSLMVASVVGFIGVGLLIGLAVLERGLVLGGICLLILVNCWGGLMHSRALIKLAKAPRRTGFACPHCKVAPPIGEFWLCGKCGKTFDAFLTQFACPNCGTGFAATLCPECGCVAPADQWTATSSS